MVNINLNYRQIGFLVGANDLGIVLYAGRIILKPDPNAVCLLHDVAAGDDEAPGMNHHAGTKRTLRHRPPVSPPATKPFENMTPSALLTLPPLTPAQTPL